MGRYPEPPRLFSTGSVFHLLGSNWYNEGTIQQRWRPTMAAIQFKDDKTYDKAIELMLELGGLFQTRHPRQLLMLGPRQMQALRNAGLLPRQNGTKQRDKKKS
jgi:hypothetical protein